MTIIERRFAPLAGVEMREVNGSLQFSGHAAVFDTIADIGPFREKIQRGAFAKSIKEADVRLLFNHDANTVMARTASGTLRLHEDRTGLVPEADLNPLDADVQRIRTKMERGDLGDMSFAFDALKQSWDDHPEDGGLPIRTLEEVRLWDVSVVTFPAYPETDAALARAARSALAVAEARGLEVEESSADIVATYRASLGMEDRAVDDSAWDGNRAMSACSTASEYRSICAGERTEGAPDERQHWALPHHYLGKGPNASGVRNALARLPQTEGLKSKESAQSHLDAHMSEINPDRSTEPQEHADEPSREPSREEHSEEHSLAEAEALRARRLAYLESTLGR